MLLGMLLGMPGPFCAQLIPLSFGQSFRIRAWDRCSAGRNTTLKESDARMIGRVKAMENGSYLVIDSPFVSTEVCGRERGHVWKRMDMCRDLWKDRRTLLICINSCLY